MATETTPRSISNIVLDVRFPAHEIEVRAAIEALRAQQDHAA